MNGFVCIIALCSRINVSDTPISGLRSHMGMKRISKYTNQGCSQKNNNNENIHVDNNKIINAGNCARKWHNN